MNDELLDSLYLFFKEFINEVSSSGEPIHFIDKSKWTEESDGSVRKVVTTEPILDFSLELQKTKSPLYSKILSDISEDALISGAVDKMVGSHRGTFRFSNNTVLTHTLKAIMFEKGSLTIKKRDLKRKLTDIRLYVSQVESLSTLLIPLPGLKCIKYPFMLDKDIAIDIFTTDEIASCVESGSLRLRSNDFQLVPYSDRVGVRIRIKNPLVIMSQEEMMANENENLEKVRRDEEELHKFGNYSDFKTSDIIEDILFALRLIQPGYVGTSGGVVVSSTPGMSSMTWIGRPTRHFVSSQHLIDKKSGVKLRKIWKDTKAQASQTPCLPPICIRRFNAAMDRVSIDDAILDHLIACEAFFLKETGDPGERGELSNRLAMRVACFLEDKPGKRKELYKFMKIAYNLRSKIAHGDTLPKEIKISGRSMPLSPYDFAEELNSVMRNVLQKIVTHYCNDKYFMNANYWDNLIFQ